MRRPRIPRRFRRSFTRAERLVLWDDDCETANDNDGTMFPGPVVIDGMQMRGPVLIANGGELPAQKFRTGLAVLVTLEERGLEGEARDLAVMICDSWESEGYRLTAEQETELLVREFLPRYMLPEHVARCGREWSAWRGEQP